MRHVRPQLSAPFADIETLRLPSTSPANASIPLAVKFAQWQRIAGTGASQDKMRRG